MHNGTQLAWLQAGQHSFSCRKTCNKHVNQHWWFARTWFPGGFNGTTNKIPKDCHSSSRTVASSIGSENNASVEQMGRLWACFNLLEHVDVFKLLSTFLSQSVNKSEKKLPTCIVKETRIVTCFGFWHEIELYHCAVYVSARRAELWRSIVKIHSAANTWRENELVYNFIIGIHHHHNKEPMKSILR